MIEGWEQVKLHEIADDLVMGQSPNSSTYNTEGVGLPFIQGNADMDGNHPKIRLFTSDPKKVSLKNDILITVRAPVGDLYINDIDRISIGRGIGAIRILNNKLACYVYYYFSWDKTQFIRLQQGTTFTEIGKREVRNLKISLPENSSEQKAIAGILSKVDEAIEGVENSIKAAERLEKSLMQNLLTGKLRPDGTWRSEDEFYIDEKYGMVPKGWELSRVKDFGIVYTGKTPPTAESHVFSKSTSENRYPFVTPGDLGEKKYINVAERYVTEKGISYSYRLPANTVCVVCIGSTIGKIGIAKIDVCTNQQINSLVPNQDNSGEFFYYMMSFRTLHFKEIAGVNATPQINKSGFNKYKLLRPIHRDEQKQIANKLSIVDDEILVKINKIESLKTLKKSLMQNLLTEKVRVNVDRINKLLEEE